MATIVIVSGCAPNVAKDTNETNAGIDYKGYLNGDMGFDVPANWEYVFKDPDQYFYDADGNMLYVTHQTWPTNIITDQDFDDFKSGMKATEGIQEYQEISQEKAKIANHDAYHYAFSYLLDGEKPLFNNLYLFCDQGKLYNIIFSSVGDKQCEEFDKYEKKIINSIIFYPSNDGTETEQTTTSASSITPNDTDSLTMGQKNAVKSAESYLRSMSFSRNELFQQLTSPYGSQYSDEDAEFAISYLEEHLLVDWNEEAKEAAKSYISSMAFSRADLYQQLTSEYGAGFTAEQAEQAIVYLETNNLVDWYAEAVQAAQSYLDSMSFSRDELYRQLTSEYGSGFTAEQAEYALSQVGY